MSTPRCTALAVAALALLAMAAALAVGAGPDAEAARIAAARQKEIRLAGVPGMRSSYLAATAMDRLAAAQEAQARRVEQRHQQHADETAVPLQQAWARLRTAVFPQERVQYPAPFARAMANMPVGPDPAG